MIVVDLQKGHMTLPMMGVLNFQGQVTLVGIIILLVRALMQNQFIVQVGLQVPVEAMERLLIIYGQYLVNTQKVKVDF